MMKALKVLGIDERQARASLLATAQSLLLILLSVGVSLVLFILFVLSLAFILLGIGLFTTPVIADAVRAHANQRRLFARDWSGVTIPAAYQPFPHRHRAGIAGQVERTVWLLRDTATWRDFGWLLTDAVAGFLTGMMPFVLIGYAAFGLLLPTGLWVPIVEATGTYFFCFVPVNSWFTALLAAGLSAVMIVLGLRFNPVLLRLHFLLTRALIGASQKELLAQRVARLTETRHDALDNSAADLRRIERDLHDGAQARLVAMGMSLGTIESLIESDPEQARKLLAQARENSQAALTELRDLVRGIHPPVLAERGLADAARALALRMPLPVEVDAELPGRLEEAVESAAYFAVSEVLTNVAKHSGAQQAWLDMYYSAEDATLRIAVTDNGRGGATMDGGTGLRGIERRLGPFDGVIAVSSPKGGPTMVTIEIPCTPLS